MPDKRDPISVLRDELAFLESGGYRKGPRFPWRPNFVFEDSPTCLNFDNPNHPLPCSECLLMQFVPEDRRETRFPCRHIPLTPDGQTVNSFYEWGTEEEMEAALRGWLLRTISLAEDSTATNSPSA
jgi:hypothetical protein